MEDGEPPIYDDSSFVVHCWAAPQSKIGCPLGESKIDVTVASESWLLTSDFCSSKESPRENTTVQPL